VGQTGLSKSSGISILAFVESYLASNGPKRRLRDEHSWTDPHWSDGVPLQG
jgi:hypothetical protein